MTAEPEPTELPAAERQLTLSVSTITRIGLLATGAWMLMIAGFLSGVGSDFKVFDDIIILSLFLYVLAFALLFLAVRRKLVKHADRLILAVVLAGLAVFYYGFYSSYPRSYSSDVIVFTHTAAKMVLHGQNPYSVNDEDVLRQSASETTFPIPIHITEKREGGIVSRLLEYPAGSLFPYIVVEAAGVKDMRWVDSVAILLSVVLLWWQSPVAFRGIATIPVIVSANYSYLDVLGGTNDMIWLLPVMLGAIALNTRRYGWAAVALGWAAATKQQPWLLAPFILIWLWNDARDRDSRERLAFIGRFGAIAAAVFIAVNLPFIVWNFSDWLTSITYPLHADLAIDGSGVSILSRFHILSLGKDVYTALSLLVLAALLASYARFHASLRQTVWLLPAITFWFAHRSLQSYFTPWIPLLMLGIFYIWREHERIEPSSVESKDLMA